MLSFTPVRHKATAWWVRAIWLVLLLALVLPTWFMGRTVRGAGTMSYTLTPESLVIQYGSDTVSVPRPGLTAESTAPGKGKRVNGTAMPGLYLGRWTFAEAGRVTLYATQLEQVILLKNGRDTVYGITPENPEAFLQALQGGQTGAWQPAAGKSPLPFVLGMLAFQVLMLGTALLVVWYFLPNPRSISYTLADDALVITGGRTRVTVPYPAITEVSVAEPRGIPLKTMGTSLPGLHWGSFSWRAAGPGLALYATQLRPLVLIRTGGKTYGVTPEEQDRFVAELSARISGAASHRP